MFPRSQRLQQRQVFDPLYQHGRMARGKTLTVRCISFKQAGLQRCLDCSAGDTDCPSRIATIVSKKVSRRAVDRNRIKRRIRHQLQTFSHHLVASHYIAVSANRPRSHVSADSSRSLLLTCTASELARELRDLLDRVHLLREVSDSELHG
ncbi:MAG: ribonuclease P protein component [Cyanobacteria bacterium P01_A01_bin.3]